MRTLRLKHENCGDRQSPPSSDPSPPALTLSPFPTSWKENFGKQELAKGNERPTGSGSQWQKVAACLGVSHSFWRQLSHFDPKPSLINAADGAMLLEEEKSEEGINADAK